MVTGINKDLLIERARDVLALDSAGTPVCQDTGQIFGAMLAAECVADGEVAHELLDNGFLRHAPDRRDAYIDKHLISIAGATFDMGSDIATVRHFCGETPNHSVTLSPFQICAIPTTNEMFAVFDPPRRSASSAVLARPAVDVTWFDAAVFAKWVGCRLPSEAEWEYACGAGRSDEWCCALCDLPRYAWYSENADRHIHPAGTREPNTFGIFDMHGNVWEWCQDVHASNYYARSPELDPVNDVDPFVSALENVQRVSRGGGFLALAEMCRVRYRLHDPASYSASDLGFRLAV
jgi:formylglycine-generating enzyme required for sulfatase activity